eukprot:13825097-Alexandrium_andersonii.AAC.1
METGELHPQVIILKSNEMIYLPVGWLVCDKAMENAPSYGLRLVVYQKESAEGRMTNDLKTAIQKCELAGKDVANMNLVLSILEGLPKLTGGL